MPILIATQMDISSAQGVVGNLGKLWWLRQGLISGTEGAGAPDIPVPIANVYEMPLPTGTAGFRRRPCWGFFNLGTHSRNYGVGAWTANILVDEHFRTLRQGIPAPTIIPTMGSGGGSGLTANFIGYLRFRDSRGQRVGPLSAPSETFAAVDDDRKWDDIPTTCPDPSVDEIQGLVSADGALPRVAWTRQLGVTTVTEAVPTGLLEDAALTDFTAMPLLGFNVIYNSAQWGFGNQLHPERVFRSDTSEIERYSGVFIQSDGEPVLGGWIQNNAFFFASRKRIYRATSHTELDIEREIEKEDLGVIGHFGICQTRGRTIVPTPEGFKLHAGEWRDISGKRTTEFKKNYKAYRQDFEAAQGHFDQEEKVYTFGPVPHIDFPGLWVDWVLNLQALFPEDGGDGRADWSLDVRARKIETRATLTLPGSSEPTLVLGTCEGQAYIGNQEDDPGDFGDAYDKRLLIGPGTFQPDPGGFPEDAQEWHTSWNYMKSEDVDWTPEWRGGGEYAHVQDTAGFSDPTPASLSFVETEEVISECIDGEETVQITRVTAEPRTLHHHILDNLAGSCLALLITVRLPIHVLWRGWGGTFSRGPNVRGTITTITEEIRPC